MEAARQVWRQVDAVGAVASEHCGDEAALGELRTRAGDVSESVQALLRALKGGMELQQPPLGASVQRIQASVESLFSAVGNPAELIRQAKLLAAATTELVNLLKREAQRAEGVDQQRRLLLAAKLLAEATARMVEAAKGCATQPQEMRVREELQRAAEDVRSATQVAASDQVQMRMAKRLELCAKQAASCATQAIAAIQVCTLQQASAHGEQPVGASATATHSQLIQQCKLVADSVPKIVQGIRGW